MKPLENLKTFPKDRKTFVLTFVGLVLFLNLISALNENHRLVKSLSDTVEEQRKGEVVIKSGWFQVGCEMAFEMIEKSAKDASEEASLQISLYSIKQQCAILAETLSERLKEESEAEKNKAKEKELGLSF